MGRLSKEDILNIYNAEGTYKELAKKYGVSTSSITHIKTGHRHAETTGASESKNKRKREPCVTKAQVQAIFDYLKDEDESRTYEEAAVYFRLPKYTIRRVMLEYVKKFKIRNGKR